MLRAGAPPAYTACQPPLSKDANAMPRWRWHCDQSRDSSKDRGHERQYHIHIGRPTLVPGNVADAELHFSVRELHGLKLIAYRCGSRAAANDGVSRSPSTASAMNAGALRCS